MEGTTDRRPHPAAAPGCRGVRRPTAGSLRARVQLGAGRPARRGSTREVRPRSGRGTPPAGSGPPPRRPRPGPLGYDGIAHGTTALDAADALDLEQAIARRAKLNGQLGDTDSLNVRRAKALGEIAREDLVLDLQVADPETGEITRTVPGRKTELILHLVRDRPDRGPVRQHPHPDLRRADQVLAQPGEHLGDRPAGPRPRRPPAVDSYEIPDRIRRQVTERDHHCGFPHCTKPAESCDLDHIEPHADGGGAEPVPATSRPCAADTTGSRPPAGRPTGCSPPAPTTGPCRRDLPGRPHRHPPAHRVHSARPARGVATQPRTPPPAGLQACPGSRYGPRAERSAPRPTKKPPSATATTASTSDIAAPGQDRGDSAVTHDGGNHVPRKQRTQPTADRKGQAEVSGRAGSAAVRSPQGVWDQAATGRAR